MQDYFSEDIYHTPKDYPRALGDRLLMNSRLFFLYKYSGVVLRARKKALGNLYDNDAWVQSSYEIFKIIESCGGHFHLSGLNNINPIEAPFVFISNHMSSLETQIFPLIIASKIPVTFVVKDSLINYPFFGPILRATKPIVVSRKNTRKDLLTVLSKGEKLLSEGISVIIFPQSTRKTEIIPEEFNSLGVKLASKTNASIIPIAIKTDFWGHGKIMKDLGPLNRKKTIHMNFGKPFKIKKANKEENYKIITFIKEYVQKWSK